MQNKPANRLGRLKAFVVALVLATSCVPQIASAQEYSTRTKSGSKIRIYEQQPESTTLVNRGYVVAKYSDLIQKAIAYKTAHPTESVEIYCALYQGALNVYVGFNPSDTATYMRVGKTDFAGSNSEKLLYSFCKAAKAKVSVKLLIHTANDDDSNASKAAAIKAYLDDNSSDHLQYRLVKWGKMPDKPYVIEPASDDQMHNKFLLVSKTRSGSTDYHSAVYTTSANLDEWTGMDTPDNKFRQTGVLVYQNAGLYAAYKRYFDQALWAHANDTTPAAFRSTMESLHLTGGGLNYVEDAAGISAYFYPVPDTLAWHPRFNPHSYVFSIINHDSTVANPYIQVNMAYWRSSASAAEFGRVFIDNVRTMQAVHGLNMANGHVKFAIYDDELVSTSEYSPVPSTFIKRSTSSSKKYTHSKNISYKFTREGIDHFYVTGGSANAKINSFVRKADNLIMIHEAGSGQGQIYSDFETIFNHVY